MAHLFCEEGLWAGKGPLADPASMEISAALRSESNVGASQTTNHIILNRAIYYHILQIRLPNCNGTSSGLYTSRLQLNKRAIGNSVDISWERVSDISWPRWVRSDHLL